jgi:uncharacterized protein YqcC (DUF446 family)
MGKASGDNVRDQLRQILLALEQALQDQGRWETCSPDAAALGSTQPFAVDTLTFDQWLQWIMLPRMHALLAHQQPLPLHCAMQPMAEHIYGESDPMAAQITQLLGEIDSLIGQAAKRLN